MSDMERRKAVPANWGRFRPERKKEDGPAPKRNQAVAAVAGPKKFQRYSYLQLVIAVGVGDFLGSALLPFGITLPLAFCLSSQPSGLSHLFSLLQVEPTRSGA